MKFDRYENGRYTGSVEYTEATTFEEIIAIIIFGIVFICMLLKGLSNNIILTSICAAFSFGIAVTVRAFANKEKIYKLKGGVKFLITLGLILIQYFGIGELFWSLFDEYGGDYWNLYLLALSIPLSIISVRIMCKNSK